MNQNITSDGWLLVRVWCLCDCLNFNAHYTLFVRTLFDWSLQVLALVDATRRSMGVKSQVNQVDLIHHTSDDEFEHYVCPETTPISYMGRTVNEQCSSNLAALTH